MNGHITRHRGPPPGLNAEPWSRPEARIVSTYLILVSAWIVGSDLLLTTAVFERDEIAVIQTLKGLNFIFTTAILLFSSCGGLTTAGRWRRRTDGWSSNKPAKSSGLSVPCAGPERGGSHPEKDYALRALKSGAAGYVTKQSAADVLVMAVTRVVGGGRYVSQDFAEHLAGNIAGISGGPSHENLSNRELLVLKLIASGKSIKEISADLALRAKTVATYRSRIAEKMNQSSNVDLTRYAMQQGLVD